MVELPPDYMHKYPQMIGGGEKQMVAIARALATDPSFVILDEPTSALDVSIQAKIINLLIRLQNEFQLSYLFITHDLSLMRNVASRVAIMYLGRICEIAEATEFFRNPYHPYTRMLLSSIPVISAAEEEVKRPVACTECHGREEIAARPVEIEVVAPPVVVSPDDKGPESYVIALLSNKRLPVMFDHLRHVKMIEKCDTCHHRGPENERLRCSTCHGISSTLGKVSRLPLVSSYHRMCIGCHRETGLGPITCSTCHEEKEKVPSSM